MRQRTRHLARRFTMFGVSRIERERCHRDIAYEHGVSISSLGLTAFCHTSTDPKVRRAASPVAERPFGSMRGIKRSSYTWRATRATRTPLLGPFGKLMFSSGVFAACNADCANARVNSVIDIALCRERER